MTNYYLIYDKILVKGETFEGDFELVHTAFKFINGRWEPMDANEINDRIMGYDPTEDSPMYGIGNSDIMSEIRKITKEEAEEICSRD